MYIRLYQWFHTSFIQSMKTDRDYSAFFSKLDPRVKVSHTSNFSGSHKASASFLRIVHAKSHYLNAKYVCIRSNRMAIDSRLTYCCQLDEKCYNTLYSWKACVQLNSLWMSRRAWKKQGRMDAYRKQRGRMVGRAHDVVKTKIYLKYI